MRHGIKKMKFKGGYDATRSFIRKLALHLIQQGCVETTVVRAKILRSYIDRLIHKAHGEKKHAYRILLSYLNNKAGATRLIEVIAPRMNDRSSGFVTIVKIGQRLGDGAEMSKIKWVRKIEFKSQPIKSVKS